MRAVGALDAMAPEEAERILLAVCGSREWARRMASARPFRTTEAMVQRADAEWRTLSAADWREALGAHPRIGDRRATGREAHEQAGAIAAEPDVLDEIARANEEYEGRFGQVFVVRASGRTAAEMLALCRSRLHNDPETEIRVAAEEQRQIMRLRLEALELP